MKNTERKFIDLKDLKVSEDGPGEISGYRSVFGEIDEGGDIVVKGFFADGISEYLQSGFTAHSHDWSFSEAVGFPVDAKEDDYGFFVKSQFHSTPDSQNIRTKARERLQAGKTVGFSFGYSVKEKQYVEAKDYKEQLPQFIKPERLAANMKKAQEFSRIRILLKGETIEDSLVTSPMQKLATATGVKSNTEQVEEKGMFEDTLAKREESFYFLFDVLCSALYSAEYLNDYGGAADFNYVAAVDQILSEFTSRMRAAVVGDEADIIETAASRQPIDFKGDLRERLPFAKHTEIALGAVEVFANRSAALIEILSGYSERSKSIMELREAKAGAVYSSSNLTHMTRIHDAMGKLKKDVSAMHGDMAALIAKAKKKDEKADDDPEEKSDQPTLDAAVLRAQSLRVQSQVLTRS
jgi:HK97 family phage prohead protease